MTIDQAIAAIEANRADAMNGRIDWPTFVSRRAALEAAYDKAVGAACIRTARATFGSAVAA